jgi:SAM-dependent methyltransferase
LDLTELRADTSARHPWEIARAKAVEDILGRHREHFASVLDYGCGDGYTGEQVRSAFGSSELVGVDPFFTTTDCGVERRAGGTIERSKDPSELGARRFDLILLCDVLEHLTDDVGVLRALREAHLAAGGLVLVTVPAFQSLFSDHDDFLNHQRRYSLAGLRKVLAAGGLTVVEDGYLFASLLPARLIGSLAERRALATFEQTGIGAWRRGAFLTRVLTTALRLDNAILLAARRFGVTLPGLSAWALCKAS